MELWAKGIPKFIHAPRNGSVYVLQKLGIPIEIEGKSVVQKIKNRTDLESSKKAVSLSIISFLCESLNPIQMMKLQMQAEMNAQNLLLSAAQLPLDELEQFFAELSRLVTRKKSESVLNRDKILLTQINQTVLSLEKTDRCYTLICKMELSTLSETEHSELITLVEEEEALNVQRLKYLVELAQLRKMTLPQLMKKLGLNKAKLKNG
jgi:hypothetical protein